MKRNDIATFGWIESRRNEGVSKGREGRLRATARGGKKNERIGEKTLENNK